MADNLRIALFGAGVIGRNHIAAIAQVEAVEASGIVDPDPSARQFAEERGLPWFATPGDLFADHQPDGVIVASPNGLHLEQGLRCIEANCPVLVEKPITVTSGEARQLVEAADAAGVSLLVGHHRRHNPILQKAREIIDNGLIGDIRSAHAMCWFYKPDHYFDAAEWRKQPGAGPVAMNLIHDVDCLRYLCGEITAVYAQFVPAVRGYANEDLAAALLTFRSGALCTLSVTDAIVAPWNWEMTSRENPAYPMTDQSCFLIGGSRGSLSVPDLQVWSNDGEPDWHKPISATRSPHALTDPLVNQIRNFADVIAGRANPVAPGVEGMRSLQVVEAIRASARSGETTRL